VAEQNGTRTMTIENVSLVTENGILPDASIYVEDGIIRDIHSEAVRCRGRKIDGHGKHLLSGFIDLHSDAIEKEIEPRPNAIFPVDYALFELDKKLASCGITTIYHSLSFAEMEVGLRSNSMVAGIIKRIHDHTDKLNVNTRIHARYEITDSAAIPFLEEIIRENKVNLLSIMDHTPGQGQFREIASYKGYYGRVYQKTDDELNQIIDRKLKAPKEEAAEGLSYIIRLCKEHGITLASHDDDSREKITWLSATGVKMCEFPVNMEAVRSARDHDISVCFGSPNIFRGNSQLKNLSAREAIAEGFGDIICSDYAPTTILHAVFTLNRLGILPLSEAVNMCTINPARAMGIAEKTGSISDGKEADLVLVDMEGDIPRVIKTFVKGKEVFSTC
jgi:alpha-D-ribose 1-methylphosphonate 5-triphosphate diphosphatase